MRTWSVRVSGGLRARPDPGVHKLRFVYWPRLLTPALGLSAAGVVGILSMGVAYGKLGPKTRRWVIVTAMLVLAGVLSVFAASRALSPTYAATLLALNGP